jgi:hypothetical protein
VFEILSNRQPSGSASQTASTVQHAAFGQNSGFDSRTNRKVNHIVFAARGSVPAFSRRFSRRDGSNGNHRMR